MNFLDAIKKSDIQKRMEIISILDPLKINTEYSTMTIDQLKEVLKKKTNSLSDITHDQYQNIYDLPVDMPSRSNEVAILEFRISNMNIKFKELVEINEKLEEELLMTQIELDKFRKSKASKTPPREPLPEPDTFAAYIASQEETINDNENKVENTQIHSKPAETINKSDYLGIGRVSNSFNGSGSPPVARSVYPAYPGYTPGKQLPGFPDQGLFGGIINNAQQIKSVNGMLNEDDAVLLAIKESESLANAPLDKPFKQVVITSTTDPFEEVDVEIITIKKLPWRERSDRYQHLKDRPSGATDEILDKIYDYLLNRDFDSVKVMLTSEVNTEVVRWIRLLSYDGSSFKQMMVTKSHFIHKAFCGDL